MSYLIGRFLRWKPCHYVFRCRGTNSTACHRFDKRTLTTMAGMEKKTQKEMDTLKFLEDVQKVIVSSAWIEHCGSDTSMKVTDFLHPPQLMEKMEFDIGDDGVALDKLLELCKTAMKYSVKTGHPRFYNQLYNGLDPYGLAGAWVTEALNTNVHTYEAAPVFIMAEHYMVKKICQLMGYAEGDGVFCPGGTTSNYYALHMARYKYNKEIKQKGMYDSPKFHLFLSEEAHYSVQKAASFMGFGIDSLVKVETDIRGCIVPEEFEKKVVESKSKGAVPLFMMASSGTTVLGAFDNLNKLADICKRHGIWLHVDAAWGGSAVLSPKHKHLMAGIERTDSVAWCLHKMLRAPIQCSVLLLQEKGILEECNSAHAEYLFQPDKFYDVSFDVGDKSLQCGRKGDALKLWLMWKAKGDKGMQEEMDMAMENSQLFLDKLKEREGFCPILPEFQFTNIGFWYIPPSLRDQERTPEWWQKIAKVAPVIKQRMMMCGSMMIGYQPLSRKNNPFVNFFRIIIKHIDLKENDLDFILDEIERLGKDL